VAYRRHTIHLATTDNQETTLVDQAVKNATLGLNDLVDTISIRPPNRNGYRNTEVIQTYVRC